VGAALASDLACEVINDGIHVHPAITAMVARPPSRLVLVTDAIDAAGMGDGDVVLGGQAVRVRDGEARLADSGSLAGSTLTMDSAVRRAVVECGLSVVAASAAASGNPARVLGMSASFGAIAAGLAADLVVLDSELRVESVLAGGRWNPTPIRNTVGTDKSSNWSRPLADGALPSRADN
jgi:N-acetylglucosamine-6-phosphate deacetylase